MSNFSPKLEDATDDQLMYMVNELSPTFTVLASDELTRRTLKKLQKTIEISNEHSEKLEIANYKIQLIMMALTAIGTLVVVFPVLKAIFQWLSGFAINISLTGIDLISAILSVIVASLSLIKMRDLNDKEIKKVLKKYKELLP